MKKIILGLLSLCHIYSLSSQDQVCDTSAYHVYPLKKNTRSPTFGCDVFIISKQGMNRFDFLNNEYGIILNETIRLDSLYSGILNSYDLSISKLDSIYELQKIKIDSMNTFVTNNLDSSIATLTNTTADLNNARISIDNATELIKKSKNQKWVYSAFGFLIGGLTIAILK